MKWLFGMLGPSAGLYAGIGAIAVVGGLWFGHWWQVNSLRNQVKDISVELALEKGRTVDLSLALKDVEGNRDKLTFTIKQQNAAIELLRSRASEADARARNAALVALRKGAEAAADLRAPTTRVPSGAEGMNEWMRGRFP